MSSTMRRGRPKIKAPKKHGPVVAIEKTWLDLANNIREIQAHNAANLSFEENHRFAYNLVLHKQGAMLYNGVIQLIVDNLEQLANEQIIPVFPSSSGVDRMQQSQEGEVLLKALKNVWDDHTSNMNKLGQILKYMDRVYTKTAEVPETREAGLSLFLKHIIRPPIQDHVLTSILNLIEFEREGHTINRSTVKGCIDVFISLDAKPGGPTVYKQDVEPAILKESAIFYQNEGARGVEIYEAPEYLRRTEARFESEESRTHHYLFSQTATPLKQILQDNLLTPHLETIISMPRSGLDFMIDRERFEDIARLYRLFVTVPAGMLCIKRALRASIMRRGKDINTMSLGISEIDAASETPSANVKKVPGVVQTLNMALKWVQDVLDLKDKFDNVWKSSMSSDRDVEAALNGAFATFINQNEKCSEYISLFIDENLKKGLRGKSDVEVEVVLEKTITIFRYLIEKDVFERYYKNHLSKRLLHGRSLSDDAEREMLGRLKVECGHQFTQKLEGMFHDMKISADTMEAYKKHLQQIATPPSIDLSVTVMTSTYWPMTLTGMSCILPTNMLSAAKSFEQFYLARHSGRRLTWQPMLGNADVRVAFKNKSHDLNVATFALVILLLFEEVEDDDFLTYSDILNATRIPEPDLKRNLQSLACAKYKILKKQPPGREVNTTDSFYFNINFSAPLQRIKINTISSKIETTEERQETKDYIEDERRYQTEACIVRVMKDRKHMAHNALINEVTRLLAGRFLPDPQSIKRRIEVLIEREYLERNTTDRQSYDYLA